MIENATDVHVFCMRMRTCRDFALARTRRHESARRVCLAAPATQAHLAHEGHSSSLREPPLLSTTHHMRRGVVVVGGNGYVGSAVCRRAVRSAGIPCTSVSRSGPPPHYQVHHSVLSGVCVSARLRMYGRVHVYVTLCACARVCTADVLRVSIRIDASVLRVAHTPWRRRVG